MKKLINSVILAAVFAVLGLGSVSAKSLSKQMETINQFKQSVQRHFGEDSNINVKAFPKTGAENVKTERGINKMSLAINLELAKLSVAMAADDEDMVDEAYEMIVIVYLYVIDTPEGDRLEKLFDNEDATMKDFGKALENVEKSQRKNLTGEEKWAFETGLAIWNVFEESYTGTEESLRESLNQLAVLIDDSPYASPEELAYLKEVIAYAGVDELTEDDYLGIEDGLADFIEAYFDVA